MNYILTAVSVILGTGKNITSKLGKEYFADINGCARVNAITSVIGCIVFMLSFGNWSKSCSAVFFILSFLYGLCTFLSQIFYIKAVKDGPVSVCSLIYSCGFIIPTVFAAIAFKENVTLLKIVGILLLVLCTFLASYQKEKTDKCNWLIPACLAMLSSGTVGVLQKTVRQFYPKWYMDEYLFLAFTFMLIISITAMKLSKPVYREFNKRYIHILTLFLAVCVVGANKLNLQLSGIMPGVIFFPAVNGGCLVLSSVMSRVIFRERFSKVKMLGLIGSVVAIVLTSQG